MDYKKFRKMPDEEYRVKAILEIKNPDFKDKLNQLVSLYIHLYPTLHKLPLGVQDELDRMMCNKFIEAGGKPYTFSGQKGILPGVYQAWWKKRVARGSLGKVH